MKNSFSQWSRCGNGMGEKLEKLGAAKMSVDKNIVANVKTIGDIEVNWLFTKSSEKHANIFSIFCTSVDVS